MHAALNPLKLTEADGYKILGSGDLDRQPPKLVEGQGGYVELRDLLGASRGRVQDWLLMEHIEAAKERGWRMFKRNEFIGETIAVCGGGASLGDFENLRKLRRLSKKGVKIFAVNRTHDFLLSKGIPVWGSALLDPIPNVKNYIKPRKGTRYYIASQCHPETLDVFEDFDKYLWHARASGAEAAVLSEAELNDSVASRTSTVGLRSIVMLYMMGFRHFPLFGFDSSYNPRPINDAFKRVCPPEILKPSGEPLDEDLDEEGRPITAHFARAANLLIKAFKDGTENLSLHAYHKPETVHDMRLVKIVGPDGSSASFYTNSAMAAQADEFQGLIQDISLGIRVGAMDTVFMYVHGEGLIPTIAKFYGLHVKKDRK